MEHKHTVSCPVHHLADKGGECDCRPTLARFLGGEFIRWSSCSDPTGVLTPGTVYEVERVEIRSAHTRYYLRDFPGVHFLSSYFKSVRDEKRILLVELSVALLDAANMVEALNRTRFGQSKAREWRAMAAKVRKDGD